MVEGIVKGGGLEVDGWRMVDGGLVGSRFGSRESNTLDALRGRRILPEPKLSLVRESESSLVSESDFSKVA